MKIYFNAIYCSKNCCIYQLCLQFGSTGHRCSTETMLLMELFCSQSGFPIAIQRKVLTPAMIDVKAIIVSHIGEDVAFKSRLLLI